MKKRVLCFGDSNTYGYDGENDGRFEEGVRWTSILQELLGNDYAVVEEGHNGRTSVWDDPVENRLAGLTYLWPCMDSASPIDLIIIMVGTNDTKNYFNCSAPSIARGCGRLVEMAQKSEFGRDKKAPEVLLVAPILLNEENGAPHIFDKAACEKTKEFPKEYKLVAELFNCHYMNAQEFAGPGRADGIHMDPEGHKKLALAMFKKVKSIIG